MRAPWRDRQGRLSPLKSAALGVAVSPAVLMAWDWSTGFFGPLPFIGLVYWSGVWATMLLLLTLAVTPIRYVFRWNQLVETRRVLGVAGLTYSIVHLVSFFALYRWHWPEIASQTFGRASLIVATISLAGLAVLGTTSFDAAVHRIGGKTWRRLHRFNYLFTALAVGHFLLSPGIFSLQYAVAGLLVLLLGWRYLDTLGTARTPIALALLAVASAAATAALEIGWLSIYQHVPPVETVGDILDFSEEVSPPWRVLLAGAILSGLAAAFQRLRTTSLGTKHLVVQTLAASHHQGSGHGRT